MTFSSIPVVKAAIVDALAAALTPVKVFYGHPGEGNIPREAVWVGGLAEWDDEYPWLGATAGSATHEKYSLELSIVSGDTSATSFQPTTERVFAIADLVQAAIGGAAEVGTVTLRTPLRLVPSPDGFTEFFTDDKAGAGRATLLKLAARVDVRLDQP